MSGEGRRLTEAEELRAAQMFSEGATDSAVAEALSCSRATANRLRHRKPKPPETAPETDVPGMIGAEMALSGLPLPDFAAELGELQSLRAKQAEVIQGLEANEQASRQAIDGLAAERVAAFAEGRVDVQLRERARNAADEAADWHRAADLGREKLAHIDEQIRVLSTRQILVADERELATMAADGVSLADDAPAVLRAHTEAVRAAALALIGYRRELVAKQARIDELHQAVSVSRDALGLPPVPRPVLSADAVPPMPGPWAAGNHDDGHAAVQRAWELAGTAASGDMYRIGAEDKAALELAAAGDLYERLDQWEAERPEFEEQARKLAAQRQQQLDEEIARTKAGPGWQPPPAGANLDDGWGRPLARPQLDPYASRGLDIAYPGLVNGPASGPGYRLDG